MDSDPAARADEPVPDEKRGGMNRQPQRCMLATGRFSLIRERRSCTEKNGVRAA